MRINKNVQPGFVNFIDNSIKTDSQRITFAKFSFKFFSLSLPK